MITLITLVVILLIVYKKQVHPKTPHFTKKGNPTIEFGKQYKNHPKPAWVTQEVIRLKALMGKQAGCRKVADTFNRLHADKQTVGKTYVANIIKTHNHQIMTARRQIKNKLGNAGIFMSNHSKV